MDPAGRWLQERLGCTLADPALLTRALTHRSAGPDNNERLEYLGDAVLSFVVAELLFNRFPEASEGELSRYRATLVSGESLAAAAATLGLGEQLRLGEGELKSGGQRRATILADALEALFGAIYVDRGMEAVRQAASRVFDEPMAALPAAGLLKDPKTRLQEWLQGRGLPLPAYTVLEVSGEPHEQRFRVCCDVGELGVRAEAEGSSRRRAEQEAAQRVLEDPSLRTGR
ncbi:MAG TPA: ribonuclease III [Steroidobacteraceae bacterium]|nr:ribonuclease III [Steroidobacteraceae bacterium]